MPTRWRVPVRELRREAPVGDHHLDRVARLELVADPVREEPAADALDGNHPVPVRRRRTQRIIAPYFLAVDRRPKRQMLSGPEAKSLAQIRGNFEADRIGFGGLRNDLRDLQRMEVGAHYQVASG